MKVLLDIKDKDAPFIMQVLKNFSSVKAKPITPYKAQVLEELKEAVDNLNLVKKGKLKAKPLKQILDEL